MPRIPADDLRQQAASLLVFVGAHGDLGFVELPAEGIVGHPLAVSFDSVGRLRPSSTSASPSTNHAGVNVLTRPTRLASRASASPACPAPDQGLAEFVCADRVLGVVLGDLPEYPEALIDLATADAGVALSPPNPGIVRMRIEQALDGGQRVVVVAGPAAGDRLRRGRPCSSDLGLTNGTGTGKKGCRLCPNRCRLSFWTALAKRRARPAPRPVGARTSAC